MLKEPSTTNQLASGDADDWLTRWLPEIKRRTGDTPIFELGCGAGRDTAILCNAGISVVGIDQCVQSIAAASEKTPDCLFKVNDIRSEQTYVNGPYSVILASLCLHYFSWQETKKIIGYIQNALNEGGFLLCRVNSTDDINFGSVGYPQIDENFYQVRNTTKRFFNESAIDELFHSGWQLRSKTLTTIYRYGKPKVVWELAFDRSVEDM